MTLIVRKQLGTNYKVVSSFQTMFLCTRHSHSGLKVLYLSWLHSTVSGDLADLIKNSEVPNIKLQVPGIHFKFIPG